MPEDEEELEEDVKKEVVEVFHGSMDDVKFSHLTMDGPDPSKAFFVTRDKRVAEEATMGHPERVLRYLVPKSEAEKILGEERGYAGGMTSHGSTEYEVEGEENIKKLHQHLDPKQKRSWY